MKKKGYWLLVLHAHLPYVRHPERPAYLEERWLFEALTECYIPLTISWLRLRDADIAFRLTLSLSPPLAAMLTDPLLQDRYLRHLELLLQLAAREEKRTQLDPDLGPLAIMYRENLEQTREFFRDRWGCQIIAAWQSLALSGHLELWTSAATHAFLPYVTEASWVPQIRTGFREHRRIFGQDPRGIWLPECAYMPGLEKTLAREGLRFFVVDTGAFDRSVPGPANV
ncbi:MAG: DUF1957 domain-containing protein, partial [Heliobacteriaceae bacterium]|nr:DUF1957 domain-containing protein [Heliobacteriaceae bacterium]